MSYLTEDSKYLLNNISALHIGGYLKTHIEFKLQVMLNDEYELTENNATHIENEIIAELPPTWFNKVSFQKIDRTKVNSISSVIIIFKM